MNTDKDQQNSSAKESAFAKTCLATALSYIATAISLFVPIWRTGKHAATVGNAVYYGFPFPLYEKTESGWSMVIGWLPFLNLLLDCWFWMVIVLWLLGVRRFGQYLAGCLIYIPLSLFAIFVLLCLFIHGPL